MRGSVGRVSYPDVNDANAAATRGKELAGRQAAEAVEDGMKVGLGTGSTVHWTIVALGERQLDIECVATSKATEELARTLGLKLRHPDEAGRLDVGIDGADEVDPWFNLTKGGGGALTREKVIAEMCDTWIVVVDESKLVTRLGPFGTPVEVLTFAPAIVAARLGDIGAHEVRRRDTLSDNGNLLMDASFGEIDDPATLAARLAAIPGLVEHGLFLSPTVGRVIVGGDGSARELTRRT